MPYARITIVLALCATLLVAAPAQARKSLKGSSRGYTLVVPGNEVLTGTVKLTIPSAAARHAKLVPWSVSCKPGKTPTKKLITLAAVRDGQRTMQGPAQSLGLVPGDRCTIKRRSEVIRHITLR